MSAKIGKKAIKKGLDVASEVTEKMIKSLDGEIDNIAKQLKNVSLSTADKLKLTTERTIKIQKKALHNSGLAYIKSNTDRIIKEMSEESAELAAKGGAKASKANKLLKGITAAGGVIGVTYLAYQAYSEWKCKDGFESVINSLDYNSDQNSLTVHLDTPCFQKSEGDCSEYIDFQDTDQVTIISCDISTPEIDGAYQLAKKSWKNEKDSGTVLGFTTCETGPPCDVAVLQKVELKKVDDEEGNFKNDVDKFNSSSSKKCIFNVKCNYEDVFFHKTGQVFEDVVDSTEGALSGLWDSLGLSELWQKVLFIFFIIIVIVMIIYAYKLFYPNSWWPKKSKE
jgi:hypothetical protein